MHYQNRPRKADMLELRYRRVSTVAGRIDVDVLDSSRSNCSSRRLLGAGSEAILKSLLPWMVVLFSGDNVERLLVSYTLSFLCFSVSQQECLLGEVKSECNV